MERERAQEEITRGERCDTGVQVEVRREETRSEEAETEGTESGCERREERVDRAQSKSAE